MEAASSRPSRTSRPSARTRRERARHRQWQRITRRVREQVAQEMREGRITDGEDLAVYATTCGMTSPTWRMMAREQQQQQQRPRRWGRAWRPERERERERQTAWTDVSLTPEEKVLLDEVWDEIQAEDAAAAARDTGTAAI